MESLRNLPVYTAHQIRSQTELGSLSSSCVLLLHCSTSETDSDLKDVNGWEAEEDILSPCYSPDSCTCGPHWLYKQAENDAYLQKAIHFGHIVQTQWWDEWGHLPQMLVCSSWPCCLSPLVSLPLPLKGKIRKGVLPSGIVGDQAFVSEWLGIFSEWSSF